MPAVVETLGWKQGKNSLKIAADQGTTPQRQLMCYLERESFHLTDGNNSRPLLALLDLQGRRLLLTATSIDEVCRRGTGGGSGERERAIPNRGKPEIGRAHV